MLQVERLLECGAVYDHCRRRGSGINLKNGAVTWELGLKESTIESRREPPIPWLDLCYQSISNTIYIGQYCKQRESLLQTSPKCGARSRQICGGSLAMGWQVMRGGFLKSSNVPQSLGITHFSHLISNFQAMINSTDLRRCVRHSNCKWQPLGSIKFHILTCGNCFL